VNEDEGDDDDDDLVFPEGFSSSWEEH